MNLNDRLYGFRVVRKNHIKELDADIYELEHEKSGARLAYLDREDEGKSFAISFATPPEDDTGVCHIIEHSVLCGSDKYPLRDPFAELLKSSLNTFLNAMTYEDKTVYPVSSRCERDFLNLVSVYLDAVFHPNMIKNPSIFHQEGWHYELENDTLTRTGVVYNEMKGAYSSPDDISMQELSRALFADGVYAKDSGGDPSAIPTLTYEYLVDFYKKYYHPSNAKMFLDGTMSLDKVLPLIDRVLSDFDRRDISVVYEKSVPTVSERTVRYEISDTDTENKARILLGYVYGEHDDAVEQLKTTVLCDYLSSTNASVLKRRLLDKQLCHDVMMYANKTREQTVVIEVKDADEKNLSIIKQEIYDCINEEIAKGLDKESLSSTLNYIEFKLRESDYGSFPRGVGYALSALGAWLYGAAPESALVYEDTLATVRAEIENGGFEKTLREMIIDNGHRATLLMIPDAGLADERAEREGRELSGILASMSDVERERIRRECEELKRWQEEDESEEAKNTLPKLAVSDIPTRTERTPREVDKICGCTAIFHPLNTGGITYASLFFNISDLSAEELPLVSLIATALTNLNTEHYSALALQSRIKASLGGFSATVAPVMGRDSSTLYLRVGASALDTKKDSIHSLIREILLTSDFDNEAELTNIIEQEKTAYEELLLSSGHAVALARIQSYTTSGGAVSEHLKGYEFYSYLKGLLTDRSGIKALPERLSALLSRILTRARLTVSVAGERDEALASDIISLFPEGDAPRSADIAPLGNLSEFILAPMKVGYAALGARVSAEPETLGAMRVARSILSYEYLWQNIRVGGGAYGAGFSPSFSGFIGFYTYRDPSPARSVGVFRGASDYLRGIADRGEDITKFIIGAMGEYDVLTTPRTAAALSTRDYIAGISYEERERERAGLLSTDGEILRTVADLIDEATGTDAVCIVGDKEHRDSCSDITKNTIIL